MRTALGKNAVFIVQTEVWSVVTALRKRNKHANLHDRDTGILVNDLLILRDHLKDEDRTEKLDALAIFHPFLEVIKSGQTNSYVTATALSSVYKFLQYSILENYFEPSQIVVAVEKISQAANNAHFLQTDPAFDDLVWLRIIDVLKGLVLSSPGSYLSDDSMIDILHTCFTTCFAPDLSEVLQKTAESALNDFIIHFCKGIDCFDVPRRTKKLKLPFETWETHQRSSHKKRKKKNLQQGVSQSKEPGESVEFHDTNTETAENSSQEGSQLQLEKIGVTSTPDPHPDLESSVETATIEESKVEHHSDNDTPLNLDSQLPVGTQMSTGDLNKSSPKLGSLPKVHSCGDMNKIGSPPMQHPYGLGMLSSLLSALVDLVNPMFGNSTNHQARNHKLLLSDRARQQTGLNLILTMLECGGEAIFENPILRKTVREKLFFHMLCYLDSDHFAFFSMSIRIAFLIIYLGRSHLKCQLDLYLQKLTGILSLTSTHWTGNATQNQLTAKQKQQHLHESGYPPQDFREAALSGLVDLWRIPGFVIELYLNYDCVMNCPNLYKDTTLLLSQYTSVDHEMSSSSLMSLEALVSVIADVEKRCVQRIAFGDQASSTDQSDSTERHFGAYAGLEAIETVIRTKSDYAEATRLFNTEPKTGIAFLIRQGLLPSKQTDPDGFATGIADFFRTIPGVDKRLIGEYIAKRDNEAILEAFIRSIPNLVHSRIDQSLRSFLESFRLPGEAPVISKLLEHWAPAWLSSNDNCFASADSAYTLAYAVIMLNVDQHNPNVAKNTKPMDAHQFRKNLKGCDGSKDFDPEMLEEIYNAIKAEEIVLPEEHTGYIRDQYLWRKGLEKTVSESTSRVGVSSFLRVSVDNPVDTVVYDLKLFELTWAPAIDVLDFFGENAVSHDLIDRAMNGFEICARVASHYKLGEVFDKLLITLCKFTRLQHSLMSNPIAQSDKSLSAIEACFPYDQLAMYLGSDAKAIKATETVFELAKSHGDVLKDGWTNVVDIMLRLHMARILPDNVLELICENRVAAFGKLPPARDKQGLDDDFSSTGNVSNQQSSGVFNNFFSYFAGGASGPSGPEPEERAAIVRARQCIEQCHLEIVLMETKIFCVESLHNLLRALFAAMVSSVDSMVSSPRKHDEDFWIEEAETVFLLELSLCIIVQNRDRIQEVWASTRQALLHMLFKSAHRYSLFTERCAIGIVHLATKFLHRDEVKEDVNETLRTLLILPREVRSKVSMPLCLMLDELVTSKAAVVHTASTWIVVLKLMQTFGCGAEPQSPTNPSSSSSSHNSAVSGQPKASQSEGNLSGTTLALSSSSQFEKEAVMVDYPGVPKHYAVGVNSTSSDAPAQLSIVQSLALHPHIPYAYFKVREALNLLVRQYRSMLEPACLPEMVSTLRIMIEASIAGWIATCRRKHQAEKKNATKNETGNAGDHVEHDALLTKYESCTVSMIELIKFLQADALQLFALEDASRRNISSPASPSCSASSSKAVFSAETVSPALIERVWFSVWRPLLQATARVCCDPRETLRMHAFVHLQWVFLHDFPFLTARQWESCFNSVVFPLLTALRQPLPLPPDIALSSMAYEDVRGRIAAHLTFKVFLQHLIELHQLPTFCALWLCLLDHVEKYIGLGDDQLSEAMTESLLNCLLVMDTNGMFSPEKQPDPSHSSFAADSDEPAKVEHIAITVDKDPIPSTDTNDGDEAETGLKSDSLAKLTWDKIGTFLPGLKQEFSLRSAPRSTPQTVAAASPPPHDTTTPSQASAPSHPPPLSAPSPPPTFPSATGGFQGLLSAVNDLDNSPARSNILLSAISSQPPPMSTSSIDSSKSGNETDS